MRFARIDTTTHLCTAQDCRSLTPATLALYHWARSHWARSLRSTPTPALTTASRYALSFAARLHLPANSISCCKSSAAGAPPRPPFFCTSHCAGSPPFPRPRPRPRKRRRLPWAQLPPRPAAAGAALSPVVHPALPPPAHPAARLAPWLHSPLNGRRHRAPPANARPHPHSNCFPRLQTASPLHTVLPPFHTVFPPISHVLNPGLPWAHCGRLPAAPSGPRPPARSSR
jgi:hypothetical protein